jgi:hypothetical protein
MLLKYFVLSNQQLALISRLMLSIHWAALYFHTNRLKDDKRMRLLIGCERVRNKKFSN